MSHAHAHVHALPPLLLPPLYSVQVIELLQSLAPICTDRECGSLRAGVRQLSCQPPKLLPRRKRGQAGEGGRRESGGPGRQGRGEVRGGGQAGERGSQGRRAGRGEGKAGEGGRQGREAGWGEGQAGERAGRGSEPGPPLLRSQPSPEPSTLHPSVSRRLSPPPSLAGKIQRLFAHCNESSVGAEVARSYMAVNDAFTAALVSNSRGRGGDGVEPWRGERGQGAGKRGL